MFMLCRFLLTTFQWTCASRLPFILTSTFGEIANSNYHLCFPCFVVAVLCSILLYIFIVRCSFDTVNCLHNRHIVDPPWASCQICKIAGCACAGNAGNVFPTTVGWWSRHASWHVRDARAVMHAGIANWRFHLNSVVGKTFPAFPAHAQPAILGIWQEAHDMIRGQIWYQITDMGSFMSFKVRWCSVSITAVRYHVIYWTALQEHPTVRAFLDSFKHFSCQKCFNVCKGANICR